MSVAWERLRMSISDPEWEAAWRALRSEVLPQEVQVVRSEPAELPPGKPDRWLYGWVLRGVMSDYRGRDDTPVPGALHVDTLRLHMDGQVLELGTDYLADGYWGVLTRLRDLIGHVRADYAHGLLRVDSIFRERTGKMSLVTGVGDLSNPHPPAVSDGAHRVANIYVPYDGPVEVLPIRQQVSAQTLTQQHRLARAVRRLTKGQALRVTCRGDSVTAGASSSAPHKAYPQLLARAFAAGGRGPKCPLSLRSHASGWVTVHGFSLALSCHRYRGGRERRR